VYLGLELRFFRAGNFLVGLFIVVFVIFNEFFVFLSIYLVCLQIILPVFFFGPANNRRVYFFKMPYVQKQKSQQYVN
jgi:hypothetical protein